ncbi:bile acid:sodium symporter family protein [Thiolapillus brandeum]|uniref:Bile acid:sodium symporter, BASS family n=1 Tax=Thiolapillus brandeum TaxID=1076588 RepID=A0A7U6JIR4_9GAMM|nr:bile acid:sodium symporter [Thiolapillus brandeum]BAO45083.1 bile acid:sodium symporter, BASS family [Thiolapillus brandeum]
MSPELAQTLTLVARISILVFVVGSMFALGLSLTMPQIVQPLKDRRRVALALLANFVLVPAIAYGILLVIPMDEGVRIGLILLATAAGAPFLPKLAEVARGDIAFSVGLMLLLMVGTIVYLPLVLPYMLQGVEVNAAKIAQSLVILMMIPLALGLFLRARFEGLARKWQSPIVKLSNLALVLLTMLLVVLNFKNILSMIGMEGVGVVLFLVGALLAGLVLGGRSVAVRNVMGLGTGQRNISAALVVAGQNFDDPKILVTLVVTAIVGLLILMPVAAWLGKRS